MKRTYQTKDLLCHLTQDKPLCFFSSTWTNLRRKKWWCHNPIFLKKM